MLASVVGFLCLIVQMVVARNAYTLGAELLANGGCDSGAYSKPPPDWTPVGSGTNGWCCSVNGARTGTHGLYCGAGVTIGVWVSIEQTVIVPTGAVGVRLDGYYDAYAAGDDYGRANLTALTSSDGFTGISNATDILISTQWTAFELILGPFPPGVVGKVRLQLDGLYLSGNNCNAYFDDLQLRPLYSTTTSIATTSVTTSAATTAMTMTATTAVTTAASTAAKAAVTTAASTVATSATATRASVTAISTSTIPTAISMSSAATTATPALVGTSTGSTAITSSPSSSESFTLTSPVGVATTTSLSDSEFPILLVLVIASVAVLLMSCIAAVCIVLRKDSDSRTVSVHELFGVQVEEVDVYNVGILHQQPESEQSDQQPESEDSGQQVTVYNDIQGLRESSDDEYPALVYTSLNSFRDE